MKSKKSGWPGVTGEISADASMVDGNQILPSSIPLVIRHIATPVRIILKSMDGGSALAFIPPLSCRR